jgi:hypothetical protein
MKYLKLSNFPCKGNKEYCILKGQYQNYVVCIVILVSIWMEFQEDLCDAADVSIYYLIRCSTDFGWYVLVGWLVCGGGGGRGVGGSDGHDSQKLWHITLLEDCVRNEGNALACPIKKKVISFSDIFRWAPPLYVLLCVRTSVLHSGSQFSVSVPPPSNIFVITLYIKCPPPPYVFAMFVL